MVRDLWNDWFVPGDIKTTLEHLCATCDPVWFAQVDVDQFARDLYNEVLFLCPYTQGELLVVRAYIEAHRQTLFDFTLRCMLAVPK